MRLEQQKIPAVDTSPEAEAFQVDLLRKAPTWERLRAAARACIETHRGKPPPVLLLHDPFAYFLIQGGHLLADPVSLRLQSRMIPKNGVPQDDVVEL